MSRLALAALPGLTQASGLTAHVCDVSLFCQFESQSFILEQASGLTAHVCDVSLFHQCESLTNPICLADEWSTQAQKFRANGQTESAHARFLFDQCEIVNMSALTSLQCYSKPANQKVLADDFHLNDHINFVLMFPMCKLST